MYRYTDWCTVPACTQVHAEASKTDLHKLAIFKIFGCFSDFSLTWTKPRLLEEIELELPDTCRKIRGNGPSVSSRFLLASTLSRKCFIFILRKMIFKSSLKGFKDIGILFWHILVSPLLFKHCRGVSTHWLSYKISLTVVTASLKGCLEGTGTPQEPLGLVPSLSGHKLGIFWTFCRSNAAFLHNVVSFSKYIASYNKWSKHVVRFWKFCNW